MLNRKNFAGPWAGLPVPWTDQNVFDEKAYRRNVARCCEAGIPGVYSGGTTGEFYAMEYDEFQAVARATVEECRHRNSFSMIGVTSTYTLGAIRRAAYAAEIGADAVQVALPFWLEVEDHEIMPFFRAVADAAGDMPISIYETTRARKILTIEQHRMIHEKVPNYIMVKANAGTVGRSLEGCRALSQFVNVFVGEDEWGQLGPAGATGSCSALVYYNPRVILGLWESLKRQDWPAVNAVCAKIREFSSAFELYMGERNLRDAAADHLGAAAGNFLTCGLRCRGPYSGPTEQDLRWQQEWYRSHWPEMLEQF